MTGNNVKTPANVASAATSESGANGCANGGSVVAEPLPCPFCGGKADIDSPTGVGKELLVYCKSCFASICGDSTPDAIAAWNRRADGVKGLDHHTNRKTPTIDKAIRRADVADEYAQQCRENGHADVEVIPLYRAARGVTACEPPKLTDAQIASACYSFRHDFGLMDDANRAQLMDDAREWARAFGLMEQTPAGVNVSDEGQG